MSAFGNTASALFYIGLICLLDLYGRHECSMLIRHITLCDHVRISWRGNAATTTFIVGLYHFCFCF